MEITKKHKVVFQLSHPDAAIHKSLVKQIANLIAAIPGVFIEVTVHGQGIDFLLKGALLKNTIEVLQMKQVVFLICENTLKDNNLSILDLLPSIKSIPSAIAHLVIRQEEGWSYIKAGL